MGKFGFQSSRRIRVSRRFGWNSSLRAERGCTSLFAFLFLLRTQTHNQNDEYNCLTLCSGSLNANPNNNVADIVRKYCDRIAFAHIRNVKHFENGDFSEASHRDCDGDTGILDILKAYHDCGFEGYIRPDHGRHLWTEGPGNVRPGYGLYDRALGIMYMLGVWDMLDKLEEEK